MLPLGIDLVTKEKRTTRVRREVILSAGALGTPKVLQLSGVGPKELLNKFNIPVVLDAPGVGANFQGKENQSDIRKSLSKRLGSYFVDIRPSCNPSVLPGGSSRASPAKPK